MRTQYKVLERLYESVKPRRAPEHVRTALKKFYGGEINCEDTYLAKTIYTILISLPGGNEFVKEFYNDRNEEPLKNEEQIIDMISGTIENMYYDEIRSYRSWENACDQMITLLDTEYNEYNELVVRHKAAQDLQKGSKKAKVNLDI